MVNTKTWIKSQKFNISPCLREISQTSYFCYSPQFTMQNRGICCLKKCFNTERSKGNFVRENLKK